MDDCRFKVGDYFFFSNPVHLYVGQIISEPYETGNASHPMSVIDFKCLCHKGSDKKWHNKDKDLMATGSHMYETAMIISEDGAVLAELLYG